MTKQREGRMNGTVKGIIAGGMIVAALPHAARAQDYDRYDQDRARSSIDTVVPFGKGGTVDLSLMSGRIRVTGWDRNEVKLVATSDRGRLRFSASEERVSLEVERHGGDVQYDVTVPRGTKLSLSTLQGSISATGVGGEVNAESVSGTVQVSDASKEVDAESVAGSVSISNVTGNISAQSTSGDVTIRSATGDIEAETVSGRVLLDGIHSSSVRTETVSGTVTYTGSIDARGKYSFVTHSGVLRLNLPANLGAVFSVETYSGDIDSDFPVTMQPGQGRNSHDRFEFTIGNGSARVSAENFSGKIIINRVGDANDRRND
jgi:DUF4097 and DUF4098 domain-containing protein YvlB